MGTTSGEKRQIEFKGLLIECPLYKGVPLYVAIEDCKECQHNRGVDNVTEMKGIAVIDILCGIPVRRRAIHHIKEVNNAVTE